MPEPEIRAFYLQLGRRIQHLREHKRITQEQLASQLNLTRASVANLEAGRQRISAYHLAVIAAALNVPVGDLMPRGEAPARKPERVSGADPAHLTLLEQVLAAVADDPGPAEPAHVRA